jgi:plasmid stability protein
VHDIIDIKIEDVMADLLIRNVAAKLKRQIEERAHAHRRSMSDEAKLLIQKGLNEPKDDRKLGTLMSQLVPPEYRGDDLVFEVPGDASEPPDFE